jgi:hypothetical protein
MRTWGLPFKFLEFSFGPTKETANCISDQCFPLHQTRRSFRATPGTFCWSMWMNTSKQWLCNRIPHIFASESFNGNHLWTVWQPSWCFHLPRSNFIQNFAHIVHHTLEKLINKDKCTANPNHVDHNSRKKAFPFTHFLAPVCFYIFSFFSLYRSFLVNTHQNDHWLVNSLFLLFFILLLCCFCNLFFHLFKKAAYILWSPLNPWP